MGGGPTNEHILLALPVPEPKEEIAELQRQFPRAKVTYRNATDEPIEEELYREATVLGTLFGNRSAALPSSQSAAPHLQYIHFYSAGINRAVDHPIYTDTTIPLTTSSGIHGPQIAEWTLMTRLTQSHAYPAYYEAQKRHDWAPRPSRDHPPTRDLAGQRLGVLGYGAIGRQIARLAHAAGMTIIAYTASPRPTPASRRDTGYIVPGTGDPEGSLPAAWYSGASKRQLHDFLGASLDWLVVCLPLTPATTGLISTAEFSLLATRHAFISNISRGPILNQDALIAALKPTERGGTAWLRGAALDVTTPEPLPPSSELWGLDNVVVTPHISGLSEKYTQRYFDILRENLRRRERGEEEGLVNEVDRRRGY